MQIRKRIEKLVRPEHHPAQRERLLSSFETFRKIVTRNMLHHEILLFTLAEMVANLRQNRMTHSRENAGLTLERIAQHLITREKCALQCNRASKPLIHRQINLAHAAFSDKMDDQITVLDQRILR
jgi:hypothetical protein